MGRMDLKNIDVIDMHVHIDIKWDNIDITFDMLYDMIIEDNLTYTILITPDYSKNIEIVKMNKDKVGLFLWYDHERIAELRNIVESNADIIKGIKFLPQLNSYKIDLPTLEEIFELIKEYNLIAATHTDSDVNAGQWKSIIEKHCDTNFILYHGFPFNESIELLKNYSNTYVDTSYTALNKNYLTEVVQKCGSEKIVFGIDSPIAFPIINGRYKTKYRQFITRELPLFFDNDEQVLQNVLHLNAKKLLRFS
jgi:predicted TIM-barrel fold metal-dependent hydrolase